MSIEGKHGIPLNQIVNSTELLHRVDVETVGPDRQDTFVEWLDMVDMFPDPFGGPDVCMSGRQYAALVKRHVRW